MKRVLSAICLLAVMLTASASLFAQSNLAGSWDMTIESPQGKRTILLVVTNDGGKYAAKVKTPQGEAPLKSMEVKGNDVTIVMVREVQGQQMEFTFKGKADKGKMGGDADFGGFAQGTWEAVPHKEDGGTSSTPTTPPASGGAMNVTGTWEASVETSQGSGTPTLNFKQDGETLTGTYTGQLGTAPLKGTVKGNDIMFSVKVSYSGQDFELKYSGKIEGNTMKGKADYGQLGEATWSAKKK